MQVARLDYKPLQLDGDNHGDPYDNMNGVQTDIQDFIAGISYQIDDVSRHHCHESDNLELKIIEFWQLYHCSSEAGLGWRS